MNYTYYLGIYEGKNKDDASFDFYRVDEGNDKYWFTDADAEWRMGLCLYSSWKNKLKSLEGTNWKINKIDIRK